MAGSSSDNAALKKRAQLVQLTSELVRLSEYIDSLAREKKIDSYNTMLYLNLIRDRAYRAFQILSTM